MPIFRRKRSWLYCQFDVSSNSPYSKERPAFEQSLFVFKISIWFVEIGRSVRECGADTPFFNLPSTAGRPARQREDRAGGNGADAGNIAKSTHTCQSNLLIVTGKKQEAVNDGTCIAELPPPVLSFVAIPQERVSCVIDRTKPLLGGDADRRNEKDAEENGARVDIPIKDAWQPVSLI